MNTIQASVSPRELRYGNIFMAANVPAMGFEYMASGVTYDRLDSEDVGCYCKWEGVAPIPLTEDWLVRVGLKKIPHFTVTNSYTLDIGRNRIVSVGNVGTPNEMIWLCQINDKDKNKIDDLICLRNYDYDGYTYVHTFQNLIHSLTLTDK